MVGRVRPVSYFLLALGVLLLALAGYGGFVLYPRLEVPGATGVGLLVLATMAGIASLFSPCSFPLLLTLLAREANAADDTGTARRRVFVFALAFAAGVTLFLVLLGAVLAGGAAPLLNRVTFASSAGRLLRGSVGLVLILFGWWPLRGRSLSAPWLNRLLTPLWDLQRRLLRRRSPLGSGLYGFGYILAGIGWTGPVLAGLAGHTLTSGGRTAAFLGFVVAALVMTFLTFGLAAAISSAQERMVRTMRASTQQVKRWGGVILILVGIWLVILAIWAETFARLLPG